jgi:hypothetical protein
MLWFLSSSIRYLTSNDEEEDRGDHFRFGSVFIKKNNQTEIIFFLKKKTETGSNRPVSVRFGFLGQKPVQTGLALFFRFWLGFSRFGSVFSVWLGFFGLARFWLGLARFFFGFFVGFGSVFLIFCL